MIFFYLQFFLFISTFLPYWLLVLNSRHFSWSVITEVFKSDIVRNATSELQSWRRSAIIRRKKAATSTTPTVAARKFRGRWGACPSSHLLHPLPHGPTFNCMLHILLEIGVSFSFFSFWTWEYLGMWILGLLSATMSLNQLYRECISTDGWFCLHVTVHFHLWILYVLFVSITHYFTPLPLLDLAMLLLEVVQLFLLILPTYFCCFSVHKSRNFFRRKNKKR